MRIPYEHPIKPTTQKRSLYIGDIENLPVTLELEIEHKGPEFTTTKQPITRHTMDMREVSEYDALSISGSWARGGGQMQDDIRAALLDTEKPMRLNISRESLGRILDIWDAYHLTDLNAACIHQNGPKWDASKKIEFHSYSIDWDTKRALEREFEKATGPSRAADMLLRLKDADVKPFAFTAVAPLKLEKLLKLFTPVAERDLKAHNEKLRIEQAERLITRLKPPILHKVETKTSGWVRASEHPDGILCKPCHVCRYEYGSEWLVADLPEEIKTEILELFSQPTPAAVQPLEAFVQRHGLTFTCERIKQRPDRHDFTDKDTRHFKCTIGKNLGEHEHSFSLYFSQGSAHTKEPTITDVLSCLRDDFHGITQGFPEWARDLGYDEDSRKAETIYNTIRRQSDQMQRTIGADAYRELLETEGE